MDSTGKLTAASAPAHAQAPARQGLWLAVVVLTALNLRPFLTAVGPLAHDIAAATGLDLRGMAWLTLLPMLLMGLGAWCGPALQQRLGARRVLLSALVVLAAGSALRAWAPGGAALIATAALCGLGVALVQAVFPGVIKRQFPGHLAPVMGLYSAALMGGGALGAQLTPLAAQGGAWRAALAWWALPVLAALVFWPDLAPRSAALLLGAGLGGSFALSMVVVLDHLPDPAQAGALSALMQGSGFLLAALAPWAMAAQLAPQRYAAAMRASALSAGARSRSRPSAARCPPSV